VTIKTAVGIALWVAAIALAMCFDRPVALHMREIGLENWLRAHEHFASALKCPGTFGFTLVMILVAAKAHPAGWYAGLFIALATVVNGINRLMQWLAGRTRPFKLDESLAQPFALSPIPGGFHGLFHWKNLCFPSGHAGLAFATATAVAMLWPRAKWRWIGYAVAAICALERVAENAHWLSDVVAGAALGVGGVYIVAAVLRTDPDPDFVE
jgi:membrane-associated phospholipid phosphatase